MTPPAVPDDPVQALADRMLRLVWTINRTCASTRVRAARETRRVLRAVDWQASAREPEGRSLRTELIAALAARWERRDPNRFTTVVAQAVLRDEYELLAPQPRGLIEAVVLNHLPLTQAAAARHLTPAQAAAVLRAAMLTLSHHAGPR